VNPLMPTPLPKLALTPVLPHSTALRGPRFPAGRGELFWRLFGAAAGLLAAGCAVNPLTPTPLPTETLEPRVVVMVILPTETSTARPTAVAPTSRPVTVEPTEARRDAAATETATAAVVVQAGGGGSGGELIPRPPTLTPIPPVWVAPPVAADVAAAEQYNIDLINAQRAAAGLPAYERDEVIMGIARARVADMVARGYRGHYDPISGISLGRSMILNAGYSRAGENWYGHRNGPVAIAEAAMAWFMTDPPHAQGILNANFTVVGVGIAFNGTQWLLVQNFAAK
jgi:uncharacterized protein YkwD